jgi:hypothetical protein
MTIAIIVEYSEISIYTIWVFGKREKEVRL